MSIAEDSAALDPTPEFLAERLLDLGDPEGALEVLDRALRRDPGSDRARALRSRALLYKRNAHALTPRPSAVDDFTEDLAETYIQRGLLEEAQVVYHRVLRLRRCGPQAARRGELLLRVLSFRLGASPDPRQRRAEELIGAGRLASALAEYRALARELPDDGAIVRRANDLRILVLGREAGGDRRYPAVTNHTTSVGATPAAVVALLEEGKLEDALVEVQRLALARPDDRILAEALTALAHLVDAPAESPGPGLSEGPATRPMKQVSFVEMHVRLGNLAAAAELYRGMIERSPGDEVARSRLEALRTLLRFMRATQERRSGETSPRPPSGEREAPDVPLKKGSRSQELHGYRSAPDPSQRPPSGFRADEDVTAVVRPEEQAELYLRQGFLEKATEIYRMLVVRHPQHIRFQERLLYVERKIKERDAPPPGPSVMELTDVTPTDARPPAGLEGLFQGDPPRGLDDPEEMTQADPIVFPYPRTEVFEVLPSAFADDGGDRLEADLDQTPVTPSRMSFEDVPTGQDHLAERRSPLVISAATAEASPTTLFPVIERREISVVRRAPTADRPMSEDEPPAPEPEPEDDEEDRVTRQPEPPRSADPAEGDAELATVMMPQVQIPEMPLPLTRVKVPEDEVRQDEDDAVAVRRIILVG